ncbi:hypothetical protein RhiirA5_439287 [Rhizophagus irregularis]|uniref:Uncharacterized protein n=1 Tax=Rhizophagus irregularis TaxID=588596 RepID=A0A2N0NI15_9GLOM|nr:hypothetical protein RhiirA5_439287 [Rhizophagus irregularis]
MLPKVLPDKKYCQTFGIEVKKGLLDKNIAGLLELRCFWILDFVEVFRCVENSMAGALEHLDECESMVILDA